MIDNKRKCSVEGCNNIGEIQSVINGKVYRRNICSTHKKRRYRIKAKNYGIRKKLILKDMKNKCLLCNWIGPCDLHRIVEQDRYTIMNVLPICPNCHRLLHNKLINISDYADKILDFHDKYKDTWNNGTKNIYIKNNLSLEKKVTEALIPPLEVTYGCGCVKTDKILCSKHGRY